MENRRRYAFFAVWTLSTIGLVWLVLQGEHTFGTLALLPALSALFACTITALRWIGSPVPDDPVDAARTGRGPFALAIFAVAGALFALPIFLGRPLLFGLPVIGAVVMFFLRHQITRREVLYALALALVAGIAGLGAGWTTWIPLEAWAIVQVLLTLTGFLAGWGMLRHSGLLQAGVGRSRLLTEGTTSALRGFIQGMMIGMPWALGSVVLGASNAERWVQRWWQPAIAIQPGIAEEAWGRLLLVPLVFLVLRRFAGNRVAFTAALLIVGYWFAYLHTRVLFDPLSTFMIGTLMVLPVSYVCLYRDVETAIGFHFSIDFVKFAAAYVLNAGLWFS
ncbi:MAG: hypothetical protein KGJ80_12550 [Chloroflexota bacterium]|nr:hypothetical protein [Chloroflexota bacterium]